MRNLITVLSIAIGLSAFATMAIMNMAKADTGPSDLQQINRNLERVANSLEIISGQRSGWKLPKQ